MKAVLFDIGGVIFDEDRQYADMLALARQSLEEIGIRVSDDEYAAAVRSCILSFAPSLRSAIYWHFTKPDVNAYAAAMSRVDWNAFWTHEARSVPRPGIDRLLQELSGGFCLALAGNADGSVREALAEFDLLKYFSSTQVSGDLDWEKPDPRFFEHILSNCAVAPEDAIMIGDRIDNDIAPAKRLGMTTILYKAGPYSILDSRTPEEAPDVTVASVDDLLASILRL